MHPWTHKIIEDRRTIRQGDIKMEPKEPQERHQWIEFKTHYIEEYEKMLAANGGNTMGQEGYGTGGAHTMLWRTMDHRSHRALSNTQKGQQRRKHKYQT